MKKIYKTVIITFVIVTLFSACKNRDLNEGEAFKPKEIHENIDWHFDKITVDGVDYLILEKDNNNPHEGFGFMAFKANKLMQNQDSILAYLQTIRDMQIKTYALLSKQNEQAVKESVDELYKEYLEKKEDELQSYLSDNNKSDKRTPKEKPAE